MGTYEEIHSARRLVQLGAAVGLVTAASPVAVAVALGGVTPSRIMAMLAWGVVFAIPPVWALLALDRRPDLLAAATSAAVVVAVVQALTFIPPVHLVVALLFWSSRRRRISSDRPVARWKPPIMAMALVLPALAMGSHLDPVCVAADGTVTTTVGDAARRGWALGVGGSGVETTVVSPEGEQTTCSADSVVWWEGLAGVLLAVTVALPGLRWPPRVAGAEMDRLEV